MGLKQGRSQLQLRLPYPLPPALRGATHQAPGNADKYGPQHVEYVPGGEAALEAAAPGELPEARVAVGLVLELVVQRRAQDLRSRAAEGGRGAEQVARGKGKGRIACPSPTALGKLERLVRLS